MIAHALERKPASSVAGIATALLGVGLYAVLGRPATRSATPAA